MPQINNFAVTVAAIIEREGAFLFVEEDTSAGLAINQPAGHVEYGESLTEALIRETHEETAWRVRPTDLVGVYQWHNPRQAITIVRFAFAAETISHSSGRELDTGIHRAIWATPTQLQNTPTPLRSPMVLRCIDDYLSGRRFPLEILNRIVPDQAGSDHQ